MTEFDREVCEEIGRWSMSFVAAEPLTLSWDTYGSNPPRKGKRYSDKDPNPYAGYIQRGSAAHAATAQARAAAERLLRCRRRDPRMGTGCRRTRLGVVEEAGSRRCAGSARGSPGFIPGIIPNMSWEAHTAVEIPTDTIPEALVFRQREFSWCSAGHPAPRALRVLFRCRDRVSALGALPIQGYVSAESHRSLPGHF